MKKTSLILFLIFATISLKAINIEGVIIDKITGRPIRDAVLLALSNNKVVATSNSNIKGQFVIQFKKGKNIHLEVVKNGYKTESTDIVINQSFIDAMPYITIKLSPGVNQDNQENKSQSGALIENIGELADLPEGYRILEAVPIKDREIKNSGFNVRSEVKDQTTNVNVDVLKTEYNKKFENSVLIPNHNFTTSYFKDGIIYYNVGKAFLSDNVKEILKGMADRLKNEPQTSLRIASYSDSNLELSMASFMSKSRSEEIVSFLINEGVNFSQLDINIYENQWHENGCYSDAKCSDEQHQENRKVELVILK